MVSTPKAETGRPYNLIGGTLALTNASRAKAHRNIDQHINTGVWTRIVFDVEDFDTRGEMSGIGRWTADENGFYLVTLKGVLSSASFTAGEKYVLGLRKNGAEITRQSQYIQVAGNRFESAIITDVFQFNAGDYLEGWVYHNSGVNDGIFYGTSNSAFAIHRLS